MRRKILGIAVAASFGVLAAAGSARALIVERVVAVIGDKPVLLSELEVRTRPVRFSVLPRVPAGPQRAAAHDQINRDVLGKMIDEELEKQAADRAKIVVTSQEIDNAVKNVAAQQGLAVPDLYKAARAQSGLTEQDYRDEIRRQILEGKMLQLRVKGRIRITEEDVRQRYERALKEERKLRDYHPAWIILRVMPNSSGGAQLERARLAKTIAASAADGADFALLAKKYSDDAPTRESGGDLGVRAPRESPSAAQQKHPILAKELEDEMQKLEPGMVTGVLRIPEGFVVMKLLSRQPSRFTTYEKSKNEVAAMLQQEQFEAAKRRWIDELKQRTHIEVRL